MAISASSARPFASRIQSPIRHFDVKGVVVLECKGPMGAYCRSYTHYINLYIYINNHMYSMKDEGWSYNNGNCLTTHSTTNFWTILPSAGSLLAEKSFPSSCFHFYLLFIYTDTDVYTKCSIMYVSFHCHSNWWNDNNKITWKEDEKMRSMTKSEIIWFS